MGGAVNSCQLKWRMLVVWCVGKTVRCPWSEVWRVIGWLYGALWCCFCCWLSTVGLDAWCNGVFVLVLCWLPCLVGWDLVELPEICGELLLLTGCNPLACRNLDVGADCVISIPEWLLARLAWHTVCSITYHWSVGGKLVVLWSRMGTCVRSRAVAILIVLVVGIAVWYRKGHDERQCWWVPLIRSIDWWPVGHEMCCWQIAWFGVCAIAHEGFSKFVVSHGVSRQRSGPWFHCRVYRRGICALASRWMSGDDHWGEATHE